MLSLGTLVVRGSPALQSFDDLVFEIPNQELSHDAINDSIRRRKRNPAVSPRADSVGSAR